MSSNSWNRKSGWPINLGKDPKVTRKMKIKSNEIQFYTH